MLEIQDWGLIDYEEAWKRQRQLVGELQNEPERNVFVVCEHPTVITVGRAGRGNNILLPTKFLEQKGIRVVYNDRGGDVTLHNPKQLVGYPIFNLVNFRQDLHWFLREIEDTIIELLYKFNINGQRVEGLTGVWVDGNRKICAIGMHCSRWVTSHGFALNVSNNLEEFNYIIPCGIKDKSVTSISKEIGTEIDFNLVKKFCIEIFEKRF